MKILSAAALALLVATPGWVSAAPFLLDFEKNWSYDNGGVDGYYGGGTAADGSSGTNFGVVFSGVSGLSNDSAFTYYSNAPSGQGVAYIFGATAFMNVADGVQSALSFYFSSPEAVNGAVTAYSGLNGTGDLLGSFDLASNSSTAYDSWENAIFKFGGTARSFDFSAASVAAFDNISPVPEPASYALVLAGLAAIVSLKKARPRA